MDHKKFLKIIGKRGGLSTKKKHNKKYYKDIGRLGGEAKSAKYKNKK